MDITYRSATKADIETLMSLRFTFLREDKGELSPEVIAQIRAQLYDYYNRNLGGSFHAIFGEVNGQVVSTAYLAIGEKPANPNFPTGKIGTVLNVFTYPEYRSLGIATGVMERLIRCAGEQGVSLLELSASPLGKPVYQKVGFTEKHSDKYTEMTLKLI